MVTANLIPHATPPAQFPAVTRDLSFILDDAITWQQLEGTVRTAAGPLLRDVRFVEQYRGKQIAAGQKSYILSVEYQSLDRTLTGEEVDALQQQVIASSSKQLGAVLRG